MLVGRGTPWDRRLEAGGPRNVVPQQGYCRPTCRASIVAGMRSLNGKDGMAVTRGSGRTGALAPLLFAALAIALPGLLADTHAAPISPNAPPALDRFLQSVRAATPATARILVAGAPPALAFYRATYLLYPRVVYSAFATDYAHGWTAPTTHWRTLQAQARHDGAGYVLVWSLPLTSPRTVVVQSSTGMLVRVQP
jgi:hypothetical protein